MHAKLISVSLEYRATVIVEFAAATAHGLGEIEQWAIEAAKKAYSFSPQGENVHYEYIDSRILRFNENGTHTRTATVAVIWDIA